MYQQGMRESGKLFINSDSELAAYMSLGVNLSKPYRFPQSYCGGQMR